MHEVDHKELIKNIDTMINLLEFDGMRSPGKVKLNSQHLHSLYFLKDRYEGILNSKKKLNKEDK